MNPSSVCNERETRQFGFPLLFGARRRTQLLGILANRYPDSCTPTQIVASTDFNYQALYHHLGPLTDHGVVQSSDTTKPKYYQLHPERPTSEQVVALHDYAHETGLILSPDTFEPLFSTDAHARFLAGLTRLDGAAFTQPEVTDVAEISTAKFYSVVSELQDLGVVAEDGKDGKAVRYERQQSRLWDLLADLEKTICTEFPAGDRQSSES